MTKLRVLSLFAGIGGFDLGLERTGGFETVAFCEIDKKARAVLAKHWPGVPCYDDVRTVTAERLAADGIAVDVICGGFPCQDISTAGAGAGIDGERSGLWADYARLIGEIRPSYVVVENVSALLSRGLGRVLGDLAALGYDADWHCIPASAVGAPHRRDRIWIVSYPNGCGGGQVGTFAGTDVGRQYANDLGPLCGALSYAESIRRQQGQSNGGQCAERTDSRKEYGLRNGGQALANTECRNGEAQHEASLLGEPGRKGSAVRLADGYLPAERQWRSEPAVGRVADGVPHRVDRIKQLGNAVVPQIPELIGRAILASLEQDRKAA